MKKFYSIIIMLVICAALLLSCESSPATITVTLKANYDGGATTTETTTSDKTYYPTWKPTRTGWNFKGWYYDESCTKSYTSTTLSSNTTLYSGWYKQASDVSAECVIDTSAIKLEAHDKITVKATYQNGPQTGCDSFSVTISDPSKYSPSFTIPLVVKNTSGQIDVDITRNGTTIGKGQTLVNEYVEGETYKVTVAAVD